MRIRVLVLLLAMLLGTVTVWRVGADNPHGPAVVYQASLVVTSSLSCCVTMVTPSVDADYIVTVYGTNANGNTLTFRLVWNDGTQSETFNNGIGPYNSPPTNQVVHVAAGQSLQYYYDNGSGGGTTYVYINVIKE